MNTCNFNGECFCKGERVDVISFDGTRKYDCNFGGDCKHKDEDEVKTGINQDETICPLIIKPSQTCLIFLDGPCNGRKCVLTRK